MLNVNNRNNQYHWTLTFIIILTINYNFFLFCKFELIKNSAETFENFGPANMSIGYPVGSITYGLIAYTYGLDQIVRIIGRQRS